MTPAQLTDRAQAVIAASDEYTAPIFRGAEGNVTDAPLWSAYADGRADEKEGLRGLLFDAFMNGLAWMQANHDEPPSAWAAAADSYVSGACDTDALCPYCNGSGEQQFMTHGHGPDDYEVTGLCSNCGGSGAAIAAPAATGEPS